MKTNLRHQLAPLLTPFFPLLRLRESSVPGNFRTLPIKTHAFGDRAFRPAIRVTVTQCALPSLPATFSQHPVQPYLCPDAKQLVAEKVIKL